MPNQELFSGLIRLHVLHHADEGRIFGLGVIEELRRHGYAMSAGTMYPLLHGLERKGLLRSRSVQADGRERRVYRITAQGRRALEEGRAKVRELFGELLGQDRKRRRPAR
jgi:DNA-binding PadR family transcriptional regulator